MLDVTAIVWLPGMLVAPDCTVKETDGGVAFTCGEPAVPEIVIEKLAEVVLEHAVAVKVKLNVPVVVGVPVMERVPSGLVWMLSPVGSVPAESRNAGEGANGVAHPPEVVNNWL